MNLQKCAITAVFTLTCFTVPVMRASGAAAEVPSAGQGAANSGQAAGGKPAEVPVVGKPEWTKGAMAEQVKALQAQFKLQQKELLQKYQELLKGARDASREEREKLRLELRDELKTKLEELISKQKELRTELRQKFEEHKELVDAAKEKAREKIKERRGNGEN